MLNYNGLYKPEWIILKCFISLIYFFIIMEKFQLNEDEVLKRLSIGESGVFVVVHQMDSRQKIVQEFQTLYV